MAATWPVRAQTSIPVTSIDGIQMAASRLSAQLNEQLAQNDWEQAPLAITQLVDPRSMDVPARSSALHGLSYALVEGLYTHLKGRATLIDIRSRDYIEVTAAGEFNLSRDVNELPIPSRIDLVMVGSVVEREHGAMVNVRVINRRSQAVVASANEFVPQRLYWDRRQVQVRDGVIERDSRKGAM